MNIAVSFSLYFVENMLNMSLGSVSKRAVLYLQSNYIWYHFLSIFLPLDDVFTLIKYIQSV